MGLLILGSIAVSFSLTCFGLASALKYFLFHKPYKILSQFTSVDGNRGIAEILDMPKDVYPVGRLDLDSEGLLLLTNDRKLNDALLNPRWNHGKTYWVQLDGEINDDAINQLQNGLELNIKGTVHKTKPAKVRRLDTPLLAERDPPVNIQKYPNTSWIELVLTEGKNRQVRRMTAKVGFPTLRLVRVGIEQLSLGDLAAGSVTMISRNAIYKKLKIAERLK